MAVTFLEERKKQKNLIWILLIVVLITVFILWQGFFKKSVLKIETLTPEIAYRKITINFQILENPFLKELQPFEQIGPYEGKIGRENPFLAPF